MAKKKKVVKARKPKPFHSGVNCLKEDCRSPLAIARDEWFESKDGIECMEPSILFSHNSSQYLRNRLETAFLAGVEAGARIFGNKP